MNKDQIITLANNAIICNKTVNEIQNSECVKNIRNTTDNINSVARYYLLTILFEDGDTANVKASNEITEDISMNQNLVSIASYCIINKCNPETIKKRCQRGSMNTAVKIGRDWLLDINEEIVDNRVTTGEYRNWRNRSMSKIKWSGKSSNGIWKKTVEADTMSELYDLLVENGTITTCDENPLDEAILEKYDKSWDDFRDADGELEYNLFSKWCQESNAELTEEEMYLLIISQNGNAYYQDFEILNEETGEYESK